MERHKIALKGQWLLDLISVERDDNTREVFVVGKLISQKKVKLQNIWDFLEIPEVKG